MMRKVLFLDCDGVLLDWTAPFLKWANAPISADKVVEYDMTKTGLWLDKDAFLFDLAAFEQTPQWADLPAMCQMTSLEMLKNAGYELRVLTLSGHTAELRMRRVANLSRKFGSVFSGVHFVTAQDCKVDWINNWEARQPEQHGYLEVVGLIEDKDTTLWTSVDKGLRALGVRRPYNGKQPLTCADDGSGAGIEWHSSVDEIAAKLVAEEVWP